MKNRFHHVIVATVAGLVVFASLTAQAAEKKVSHEIYLERANALIRSYQYFAAAMALQQALRLADDKYPSIYMRQAILYYGLGMIPDAIAAGEKAVALSPQTKWYKFDLAKFYLVNKQYKQAKEQLLAMLQIDPGFALAYVYLGEVYLALGEKNMAWFCLQWANKLGQDGDLLQQKLQNAGGGPPAELEALAKGQPAFFRYIKTENRKDADALLKQIANGKSFENLEMEFQNADPKNLDFRADFGVVSAPELDAGVVKQLASAEAFAPPVVVQTGSDYRVIQKILPFNRATWASLEASAGTAIASNTSPSTAPPATVASQAEATKPPRSTTPSATVASQVEETKPPPSATSSITVASQVEETQAAPTAPSATVASQEEETEPPPATASQPAAAVADQQRKATPAADEASVAKAIETWRGHWQNADSDLYLACYSPSFVPAKGMSHEDWRASRVKNLSLPSMMQITLSDIRITMQGADRATATFKQNYASDRMQDSVIKTLSLSREGGAWKITKEKVDKTL